MQPVIIAPSLLAAQFSTLQSEIVSVTEAGADWLHIDVMDGSFVPPISFGDNMVRAAKQNSNLFLDVHLMIVNPEKQIAAMRKAGADNITVHLEACSSVHAVVKLIKETGAKAGVTVSPKTPIQGLFPVLPFVDLVLVMTVEPGWGGQPFIRETLTKVQAISEEIKRQKLSVQVQVDGGINAETVALARSAGANNFVAGSAVFGSKDRRAAIASLRAAAR